MSLFKARQWWSTYCGEGESAGVEEHGEHGMLVGNVDNDPRGASKIVTGSLHGILRVFSPSPSGEASGPMDDLVHEERFDAPILDMALGRFIPAHPELIALAVLHPRVLAVHVLEPQDVHNGRPSFYTLVKQYEHQLGIDGEHFTACNMTHGPFGGVPNRDLICVQSMDGRIQIFEQDSHAFSRRLNNVLVPGPIVYVQQIDAFVTMNSVMKLDCYKYQVLAASGGASAVGAGDRDRDRREGRSDSPPEPVLASGMSGIVSYRSAQVEWSVNLGEYATDICVGRFSRNLPPNQVEILVLGEQSLFVVKQSGSIRSMKRFNDTPLCFHVYNAQPSLPPNEASHHLLVATQSQQLYVFRDLQLLWAASLLQESVVNVNVARFGNTDGLVVMLSDDGHLSVNYMGTDPPTTAVANPDDGKELNYDEIDEEHKRLLQVIRNTQSDVQLDPREQLVLRAQVPNVLDQPVVGEDDNDNKFATLGPGRLVKATVRLYLSYSGNKPARNVHVALELPEFVEANPVNIHVPEVRGSGATPLTLPVQLIAKRAFVPSSLDCVASATYVNETGEPRATQCTFALPMCMAMTLRPPMKSNAYRLTLLTNRAPARLMQVYHPELMGLAAGVDARGAASSPEEVVARAIGSTSMAQAALGFQLWTQDQQGASTTATVLASANSGKYRVQSDSLSVLWLVAEQLEKRLCAHFAAVESRAQARGGGEDGAGGGKGGDDEGGDVHEGGKPPEFRIEFASNIPLEDFYECIDQHFRLRQDLHDAQAQLNDTSHQFRLIERRLLARFKDKNPSPLNHLDVLLHETYMAVQQLADDVGNLQHQLKRKAVDITCIIRLITMLTRLRFGLSDEEAAVLEAHLCPGFEDNDETGWEETVDTSLTFLLKTALAKNAKETVAVQAPTGMPQSTTKLKKRIGQVIDRVAKGVPLISRRGQQQQQTKQPQAVDDGAAQVLSGSPGGAGDESSMLGGYAEQQAQGEQSDVMIMHDADAAGAPMRYEAPGQAVPQQQDQQYAQFGADNEDGYEAKGEDR